MTPTPDTRRLRVVLTVDLEDYRRHEIERQFGGNQDGNPEEVNGQTHRLLDIFAAIKARATFFSEGRLVGEIDSDIWRRLATDHRIGCHGYTHRQVEVLGREGFLTELQKAKRALEDVSGAPVVSFRAPYFSGERCDPWFGACLAEAGFRLDSSRRYSRVPEGADGSLPLPGAEGAVREIPLSSIGVGRKRLTVIGGSYFRLLPVGLIFQLLQRSRERGFLPMVYLHPYDFDAHAIALESPPAVHWSWGAMRVRLGDELRRLGRTGAADKLRAIAKSCDFVALEDLFCELAAASTSAA